MHTTNQSTPLMTGQQDDRSIYHEENHSREEGSDEALDVEMELSPTTCCYLARPSVPHQANAFLGSPSQPPWGKASRFFRSSRSIYNSTDSYLHLLSSIPDTTRASPGTCFPTSKILCPLTHHYIYYSNHHSHNMKHKFLATTIPENLNTISLPAFVARIQPMNPLSAAGQQLEWHQRTLFQLLNQPDLPCLPMPRIPPLTSTFFRAMIILFTSNLSIYDSITIGSSHHIFLGYSIRLSYE